MPLTIEQFNKQFEGGEEAARAVEPTIKPALKTPRTIEEFNALYEKIEVPKEPITPIVPAKEKIVSEFGIRPVEAEEGTAGTFRIVTPKVNVKGIFSPAGEALNVISESTELFVNRLVDIFDFAAYQGVDSTKDAQILAAKGIKFVGAAAGLAFAPISAELAAAGKIPILNWVVKPVNWMFGQIGAAGQWLAGKAIDVLPISEEAKSIFREPIAELGGYAAPLVFAKVSGPALQKMGYKGKAITTPQGETFVYEPRPGIPAKIARGVRPVQQFSFAPISTIAKGFTNSIKRIMAERKAKGEDVNNPDTAKQIVNQAAKETPAEIPGTMAIKKINEKGNIDESKTIKLYTNQKLVLQNFIKGREDIDYKKVTSLGKDTQGNQITARFEWDYKKQRATIYTTNKTTAGDLAHELGHYFDRKMSSNIGTKLSDIIPNYGENKAVVDGTLAAYAIERLGGNATKKQIDQTIGKFVEEFKPQVQRLSSKETRAFNDKFAEAVKEVILRPKESLVKAPDLTAFVQHSLGKEGPFARRIKSIEAVVKPKKITKKPDIVERIKTGITLYHGTTVENAKLIQEKGFEIKPPSHGLQVLGEGIYLTPTKKEAISFGEKIIETKINPDIKIYKTNPSEIWKLMIEVNKKYPDISVEKGITKFLQEKGYGGTEVVGMGNKGETYISIFNPKDIITTEKPTAKFIEPTPKQEIKAVEVPTTEKGKLIEIIKKPEIDIAKSFDLKARSKIEKYIKKEYGDKIPDTDLVTIGKAGDWITNPKLKTILKDVLDTQVTITEGFERPTIQGQVGKLPNNKLQIQLRRDLTDKQFARALTEELLHSLRIQKGRINYKAEQLLDYLERPTEISAKKGVNQLLGEEFMGLPVRTFKEVKEIKPAEIGVIEGKKAEKGIILGKGEKVAPVEPQAAKLGVVEAKPAEIKPFKGEPITTKAFNEAKINAPEDVINVLKDVAAKNKQFSGERRSATLDEMKQFSFKYLGDQNLYKNVPADIRGNIGRMKAAQQTMVDMASDLIRDLKTTDIEATGPKGLVKLRDKLIKLEQVTSAFAGARTETSHLFASLKAEVSPGENNILRELAGAMKKAGMESKTVEDFISTKNKLIRETKGEAYVGVWYGFLLSGPTTFIKNAVSTAGSALSEFMSSALRRPKEVPEAMANLWSGLKDGWGIAKEVAAGKRPGAAEEGKFMKGFRERGKIPYEFTGREAWLNKVRIVGRLLAASDTVFNEGLKRMELGGLKNQMPTKTELLKLGTERAIREGFRGSDIQVKAKEYANNPDIILGDLASKFALEGTYNNDPYGILGAVSQGISKITRAKPVGKFIVPFTRIVANVLNRAIDYTPYGFTRTKTGEGLFGGKISGLLGGKVREPMTIRQQRQQTARAVIGTMAIAIGAALAADDRLSGTGPANYNRRNQLMDTGWRPNSIRIGDVWMPYINLGPLALPLAIAANAHESVKYKEIKVDDMENRIVASIAGAASTIFDMSFLSGASNFMDIIASGDPKQLTNFISRSITSVDPNLLKQISRMFDPTVYSPENIWERIQTDMRIAGFTGVKPKLNVFGEVVKGDRITAVWPSVETKDPVKQFLAKNQLWISIPSKSTQIKLGPQDVRQMTTDEYYQYVKESGPEIYAEIQRKIPLIERQETQEKKQDIVNDVVNNIRQRIKNQIQREARK